MLCIVVVISCDPGAFIWSVYLYILQGCFTGTGAIIWFPQCLWSNPKGHGWNWLILNHNKVHAFSIKRSVIATSTRIWGEYHITAVYPIKHTHSFVVLCFVVVTSWYHWLPAWWASGFSVDHQQNHQCLWFHSCYNVTHVFCPSLIVFCWE